jgi:hypothetical protein
MTTPLENLKILIKPLQNAGFSLSDFVKAYLENRNKTADLIALRKLFGDVANETVIIPLYSSLSFKVQGKLDGPGKPVNNYTIDLNRTQMANNIQQSMRPSQFPHFMLI